MANALSQAGNINTLVASSWVFSPPLSSFYCASTAKHTTQVMSQPHLPSFVRQLQFTLIHSHN